MIRGQLFCICLYNNSDLRVDLCDVLKPFSNAKGIVSQIIISLHKLQSRPENIMKSVQM